MTIKFFYNGIKGTDGKLQKCSYSDSALLHHPAGTITIYGRRYIRFSQEIAEALAVENDSDLQTDYFENDRIRVIPTHPLYAAVKNASVRRKAKYAD